MHTPLRFVFTFLLMLIAVFGLGCSNTDAPPYVPTNWVISTGGVQYLPLTEGRQSIFTLYYPDGSSDQLSTEFGSPVSFGSFEASAWYLRLNNDSPDTCYLANADSSVYFYSSRYAAAERILSMPVTTGKSWSRFVNDDLVTGGDEEPDTSNTDGGGGGGGGLSLYSGYSSDANGPNRIVPFNGGTTAKVERIENIVLRNGVSYYSAALIQAENSGGTTNQYWYVPGYGLTKFILNASSANPSGTVCGELIYFAK